MSWQTFWLEPTAKVRAGLRRYHTAPGVSGAWNCGDGWHDAITWLPGDLDERRNDRGHQLEPIPAPPDHDPRWPATCSRCPYVFTDLDARQVFFEHIWRRTDTGELRVLHPTLQPPGIPAAETGAMWDADWMGEGYRGPDGICLTVRCPGAHDWTVDGPSSTGGRWTRTGDPRRARTTATPSIMYGEPGKPGFYHGFLQEGRLTDSLGG